jgi:amino acid permease
MSYPVATPVTPTYGGMPTPMAYAASPMTINVQSDALLAQDKRKKRMLNSNLMKIKVVSLVFAVLNGCSAFVVGGAVFGGIIFNLIMFCCAHFKLRFGLNLFSFFNWFGGIGAMLGAILCCLGGDMIRQAASTHEEMQLMQFVSGYLYVVAIIIALIGSFLIWLGITCRRAARLLRTPDY